MFTGMESFHELQAQQNRTHVLSMVPISAGIELIFCYK